MFCILSYGICICIFAHHANASILCHGNSVSSVYNIPWPLTILTDTLTRHLMNAVFCNYFEQCIVCLCMLYNENVKKAL